MSVIRHKSVALRSSRNYENLKKKLANLYKEYKGALVSFIY